MNTLPTNTPRAIQVSIDQEALHVVLLDRRRLSVPLDWFPQLAHATNEQRQHWRLIGQGVGIHWDDIDEDISIAGLLAGQEEHYQKQAS